MWSARGTKGWSEALKPDGESASRRGSLTPEARGLAPGLGRMGTSRRAYAHQSREAGAQERRAVGGDVAVAGEHHGGAVHGPGRVLLAHGRYRAQSGRLG